MARRNRKSEKQLKAEFWDNARKKAGAATVGSFVLSPLPVIGLATTAPLAAFTWYADKQYKNATESDADKARRKIKNAKTANNIRKKANDIRNKFGK